MADAENVMATSKKRASEREISKDNPGLDDDDDENVSEQELGTFKKASEEVLATRRIVKVRRQTSSSVPPVSNPFAGIQLVPPKAVSDTPVAAAASAASVEADVKETEVAVVAVEKAEKETEDSVQNSVEEGNGLQNSEKKETINVCENENTIAKSDIPSAKEALEVKDTGPSVEDNKPDKVNNSKVEQSDEANKVESSKSDTPIENDQIKVDENSSGTASNISPFLQLSGSKNAFTGFTGTGFSGSAFSFSPISNNGTAAVAGPGAVPSGQKTDQPLFSFGFSTSNENGSIFGAKDSSLTKSETAAIAPSLQEVPTETGEENEKVVFSNNSSLFEYLDGGWKERGRGEVKVNVSTLETSSKARLVMRTRGNLKLILNASIYPEMKLTYMDKKGITFACINSNGEGKGTLTTYALKFKDGSIADEFHAVVTEHKGSSTNTTALKTPENSPQ